MPQICRGRESTVVVDQTVGSGRELYKKSIH